MAVRRFVCPKCGHVHGAWAPRCASCTAHGLTLSTSIDPPVHAPVPAPVSPMVPRPSPWQDDLPPPEPPHLRLVRTRAPSPEPELSPEELMEDTAFASSSPKPVPITEIAAAAHPRISTGLPPLDHVLGGGLVVSSVVLLASPPGIGKSSLSLQMLVGLGGRVLYVSGEETEEQIATTAGRIGALTPDLFVLCERDLAKIFAHARELHPIAIAIDSIQKMTCDDVKGRAGSPAQVKECTERLCHYAKQNKDGTAVWIIGHVTGDGDVAGPKTIEHDVDVVLEMTKGTKFEGSERVLSCSTKNRFGATNVTGHLQLTAKGFAAVDADGWNEEL